MFGPKIVLVFPTLIPYCYSVILYLALFFIVGSVVGSFLNVVIDRVMRGGSILGRSHCDWCKKTLSAVDLVPILSYAVLGGRCRRCGGKLSFQYPIVETITAILFTIAFYVAAGQIFSPFKLVYFLFLICIVVVVAVVDFKFSLIPTSFLFFASLITLFYNYFSLTSGDFVNFVLAGFAAAAFFVAIILVTRGRGMGEGDVPLAFLMGLVLGPSSGLVAFFVAFFAGAVVSVFLIIFGRRKFGQTVPFGPFLVLGFLTSLFVGQQVLGWYLMLY